MASETSSGVPNGAASAVLKPSVPVPEDAKIINGIEFNDHETSPITVEELVEGMSLMGFQASAVSEAVQIINEMVRFYRLIAILFSALVTCSF